MSTMRARIEAAIEIEPVTPQAGALVRGLTLSPCPTEQTLGFIRRALADHLVLVFEDQDFTAEGLRDFVSRFGPLFLHHVDDGVIFVDAVPEVLQMLKEPDGDRLFGGGAWHADVTFRKPAGYLSVLYATIIPPVGGDTGFASTIAAFNALSPAMQALLRRLKAVHNYAGPGQPESTRQSPSGPSTSARARTCAEEYLGL